MTNRLAPYVIKKLGDSCSFTNVAKDVGLSVPTVIRIFELVKYPPSQLPTVLSIDEFKASDEFTIGETDSQKVNGNGLIAGKKCPDCGAHALIKRDGCEYCTSCGFIGTCG